MRIFIAIELPDQVRSMLARLRRELPGARWLPAEQLHLTMAFLGELDQSSVNRLTDQLSKLQLPDFALHFSAIGCFPDQRQARVLWIGVQPEPLLTKLARSIQQTIVSCEIPLEQRPFSPHITLARFKPPAAPQILQPYLRQHSQPKLPAIEVREFILFQSRLTSQGAIHTPLERFALH